MFNYRLADDLWHAVEDNKIDEVRSLLEKGAEPNHSLYWKKEWKKRKKDKTQLRSPPLHTACKNGKLKVVKMLVESGAKVDKGGGKFNRTPLHHACGAGYQKVVVYLTQQAGCEVGESLILAT